VSRIRTVNAALPTETAKHDGLAYTLWLPDRSPAKGGVVVLHGAGSCKESHHDYARLLIATGLAAICFDARGHGETGGELDGRAGADVAQMAALLREKGGTEKVAVRGSSMGGYLALVSAEPAAAAAVVAICPAPARGLRRGIERGSLSGEFGFAVDTAAFTAFLDANDEQQAVGKLTAPLLILHAEGDEVVPVQVSRELESHMRSPGSRLITVPGGHHRSIQHDGEMQAISLRFIERALAAAAGPT
jgi:uncharacterized protein